MNLLEAKWMPVRLRDGSLTWVAPHQLADEEVAGFDAPRADFNGALAQFAIGLLQTVAPVDSPMRWRTLFNSPPSADTLRDWFAPHAAAFEFDGDGARFMQDFDLRSIEGDAVGIAGLLIETPGENTLKNNGDHFVKRGLAEALCQHCAVLALFTLQVNAPAGGAGHRTGLRGGGPLTTLLVAQPRPAAPRSLWHDLWLNVQEFPRFMGNTGRGDKTAPHLTFPWLASIGAIQKEGGETSPIQVHPAHAFWAMPRRIRFDFDSVRHGVCDLCGCKSDRLLHQYATRNYGLNYKGPWQHPLSPYYEAKDGWLPLHPQPGGIGYRHWLGCLLGMQNDKRKLRVASVIDGFLANSTERKTGIELRLWAFGFDMDNMKARCWYEAILPIYSIGECAPEARTSLREDVGYWLAGTDLAASYLRGAVKDAWFRGDARGSFEFIDASFWSRTEPAFYALLKERIEVARDDEEPDRLAAAGAWLNVIRNAALVLFDGQFVGAGLIERQHPARVSAAYRFLRTSLYGNKLREALGLPPIEKDKSKPGKKATKVR
jgi:CRISPR system Cascade subunit CasA